MISPNIIAFERRADHRWHKTCFSHQRKAANLVARGRDIKVGTWMRHLNQAGSMGRDSCVARPAIHGRCAAARGNIVPLGTFPPSAN